MALPQRIAIIGPSGQLGSDLMKAFEDLAPVAFGHAMVDVEQPASLMQAIRRWKPDAIVNTAAYHNVDLCEAFPARAFAVNALAVDSLAAICAASGIVFCHVSTDYVFSGDAQQPYGESDEANPVNVYGCSKRAGEQLMTRHAREQYIIRTSGLFGMTQPSGKGLNFIERMIRGAESGAPLKVVDDITFSPSFTKHVAESIRGVMSKGAYGTYHVTNAGSCSWYDLASESIRAAGIQATIERAKSNGDASPRRPRMSALRHDALAAAGLDDLPAWPQAVAEYVTVRARG